MDVIFFPRSDYSSKVEVCNHRLGKVMTYTDQTDTHSVIYQGQDTFRTFLNLAKERNIKVGCFLRLATPVEDENGAIMQDYENGKLWLDAYSFTEDLATKIRTGGVITEEEWNNAYNTVLLPNFYNFVEKKPITLSYSYGNASFKDFVLPKFLCARNSAISQNTDYGVGLGNPADEPYSVTRYKSKASTTRWYDDAKNNGNDFSGQLEIQSALIDATKSNGGWLNNFTHWHNYYQNGNGQWAEAYLNMLAQKNVNNDIYFAGYGEAVAYLVYRQLITKVAMYSPKAHPATQLVIRLEANNNLGVDTDLLQVPVSVRFTTAGTPLAGQSIRSSRNLISLGNNEYIVEIPYSRFPIAVINKE